MNTDLIWYIGTGFADALLIWGLVSGIIIARDEKRAWDAYVDSDYGRRGNDS